MNPHIVDYLNKISKGYSTNGKRLTGNPIRIAVAIVTAMQNSKYSNGVTQKQLCDEYNFKPEAVSRACSILLEAGFIQKTKIYNSEVLSPVFK